jgi:hypothetical protein
VAEWALLYAQVPAFYPKAKPGDSIYFQLEAFDSRPQLERERTVGIPSLDTALYRNVVFG